MTDESIPLTFRLIRKTDVSGTSGTGHVADGVQFPDGTCVLRWRTAKSSTAVYSSRADLMAIHGHDGATVCEWAMAPADVRRAGLPTSGAAGRWTVNAEGDRLYDGDDIIRAEVYGPDELTADIAARLNGPSPAEVAAFLHSVEWSSLDGATEGSYGYNRCPSCQGFEPDHEPDCKLAAMIKQCEGA